MLLSVAVKKHWDMGGKLGNWCYLNACLPKLRSTDINPRDASVFLDGFIFQKLFCCYCLHEIKVTR